MRYRTYTAVKYCHSVLTAVYFLKERDIYERNHQPYCISSYLWPYMVVGELIASASACGSDRSCSFYRLTDIDCFIGGWHSSRRLSSCNPSITRGPKEAPKRR